MTHRHAFDAIAHRYAGSHGGLDSVYAAARPHLERLIAGRAVLDVGGGGVTPYDASRAASLTVLDESAAMLARLPEGRARKVAGDAGDMSMFADASFDLVLFNQSLHHVMDAPAALREAWRVLRPGGDLVIHEPTARPLFATALKALSSLLSRAAPVRLRTRDAIVAALAGASGRAPESVEVIRLSPRGWADPFGGTFPGKVRLPMFLHPTRFELLLLPKPRG
ncbi:MAG: class I SAM-dependent methyltransferase [Elusimicrobiota bacterium]|nr:class I SAM-dependent methyltransferase [Elusimicrobiota bacterium]